MTEDREGGVFFADLDHVAQFHDAARAGQDVGGDGRGQKGFIQHAQALVPFDHDRDGVAPLAAVRIAHGLASIQQGDRVEHILFLDLEKFQIVSVDRGAQAARLGAKAVVHIHHVGHGFKGRTDLGGRFTARLGGGAIDLGQQASPSPGGRVGVQPFSGWFRRVRRSG